MWGCVGWVAETDIWVYMQIHAAAAAAKSLLSCLTLCDPIDCSPPGSPVGSQTRLMGQLAEICLNTTKLTIASGYYMSHKPCGKLEIHKDHKE